MQAMKQHANFALILTAMALAACGGGGAPVSQQPTVGQQGAGAEGTVQPADLARSLDNAGGTAGRSSKARIAANAIPRMGSVTQSSNVDSSGRTTDRASAAFNGSQLALTVEHQDGTSTPVTAPVSAFASPPSENSAFPGHQAGLWILGREENQRYSALIATISYSPADASDWLAGGLLITADGSGGPVGAGDIDQIAWIDGPEISGNVDLSGASGSAVYAGAAIGNYTSTNGGNLEVGMFQSPFRLTANFDASSISGCVGCGQGVQIFPYFDSEDDDPQAVGVPFEFRLGQIGIGSDGIFNNGDVTISTVSGAGLNDNALQGQSGKWGGRFSTRLVADSGLPRTAAVAFGGSFDIVPDSSSGSGRTAVAYQGVSLPTPSN